MADEPTSALHGAAEAAQGAVAEAVNEAAHGAEAAGMPQIDVATFPNQIFWLVVALIVTFYALSRIALPRIAAVLAERQGTITNDIAQAEDLRQKAAEAETAYEQALADARAEAQRISAETKAEIQAELAAATAAADAEISAKTADSESRIAEIRASALESVEVVARDTANAIVEAFGSPADEAAVDQAVRSRIGGAA